jgi:hypothetical protein
MNTLPTLTNEQYQSLMQLSNKENQNFDMIKLNGFGDLLSKFLIENTEADKNRVN